MTKQIFFQKKVSATAPKGADWVKIGEQGVSQGLRQVNVTAPVETLESMALQKIDDAATKAYLAAIAAGKSPDDAKKAAEAAAREAAIGAGFSGKMADNYVSQAVTNAAISPAYAQSQLLGKSEDNKGEEFVGAISATHEFYIYKPETKKWETLASDLGFDDLPGKAEQVDVNNEGLSVAVNDVFQGFWRAKVDPDFDWSMIKDRSFLELYVNDNDMIWGLEKDNSLVAVQIKDKDKWDGSSDWKDISTPKPFDHITVTEKDVWGATADGDLYYRTGLSVDNPYGTDWEQVDPTGARIKSISADRSGEHVWGLSLLGEILFRKGVSLSNPIGTEWEKVPGSLASLVVSSEGAPYGLDQDGELFTRKGVTDDNPMGTDWDVLLEDEEKGGEKAPLLKNIFISEVALPLEGHDEKPKAASSKNKKRSC